MRYEVKWTNRFKKEVKVMKKRKADLPRLYAVIEQLANGETLSPEKHDHALTGDYAGFRECHIAPDWLLIYKIIDDVLVLTLSRTGTHSDLF